MMNNRQKGFTLVELMIVVAILGIITAIAIPNFLHARKISQKNSCIENLRLLDGAREQCLIGGKEVNEADLFGSTCYIRVKPVCPGGGTYSFGSELEHPACTIEGHALPR